MIARRCLLRTRNEPPGDDVLLALQGYDDPELGRCPALGVDARCTLHGERKPIECRAVPLDPLIPDRLQGLVLDARADEPVFEARSDALACEKRFWGKTVFERSARDLFSHPSRLGQVPYRGFLVMSAAPVLLTISAASERVNGRCREFLEAQIVLGERRLASTRRSRDIEAFTRMNRELSRDLAEGPARAPWPAAERDALEAWLGLEGATPRARISPRAPAGEGTAPARAAVAGGGGPV